MRSKLVLGSAACVLSLLRAAPADAAVTLDGKAPLPPLVYFDAGGELLRVDNRVLTAATANFLESSDGCVEIPIERAVLAEGERRGAPISRSGDVVHLGATRSDVRELTGKDVDAVLWWDRVLTQRTCRSAAGASVTLEVGADRMSVLVPWGDHGSGTVTINGESAPVGLTESGYQALASKVRNPDELASGIVTLASVSSELGSRYTAPVVVPMLSPCFWPCFRCGVAATGLIVGGTATLVATCGAAVATAGGLTPACVAGGIAYFSGALAVADLCLACDACINPKPPSGGSGGSSGGDPQQCPKGYHECCTNECCSDVNPPASCD